MELLRQIHYGYDPATERLPRVLRVVELGERRWGDPRILTIWNIAVAALIAQSLSAALPATMDVMPRRFFIQTVGCQMNVLDSELIAAELMRAGYEQVDSLRRADIILFNTCSVRQHAEDKIYMRPSAAR